MRALTLEYVVPLQCSFFCIGDFFIYLGRGTSLWLVIFGTTGEQLKVKGVAIFLMIVLIQYYWNGWLLIVIDKRWSLDETIGNYIHIFLCISNICTMIRDSRPKSPKHLFAWWFRKSDIVLARVRLQSEDRPPRQTPGAVRKMLKKGLAFSTKMRPNKSKWCIPTWTIRLPRTERGSLIAQGQCKEKENQRASYYFLQSVLFCQYLLFLEIHSIYLDICRSKLLPLVAGEIVLSDPIIVVIVRWQQVENKIV